MGYIGQHLTSVVTGFPGGRSGARGKDLLLPDDKYGEIKTCYRVDQLGSCSNCGHAVASIELVCPSCGSDVIDRKDDSKWLIGAKSEQELVDNWKPESFYLVLFDFADLRDPRQVNARIWKVDPRSRGFAYALVDYYFNIRAKSTSKAPFNLWPFSFKFGLLGGELIYSATITENDAIETHLFPNERGEPEPMRLEPLTGYTKSTALTDAGLLSAAHLLGVAIEGTRSELLTALQTARGNGTFTDVQLQDALAEGVYGPLIGSYRDHLPDPIRQP